jgi:hypothetical protein
MNETFVKASALELQRCANLKWNDMYDVHVAGLLTV